MRKASSATSACVWPASSRAARVDAAKASSCGGLLMSPDPVPVTNGDRFRYTGSWDNLGIDQRWFGYVNYVGRGDRTYITIN